MLAESSEFARLEGRRSGIAPDRLVDAAGTLRSMVHLLAVIAEAQISIPHLALSIEAQTAHKSFEEALRNRFQSWLDEFENSGSLDRRRAIALASSRTLDDSAASAKTDRIDARLLALYAERAELKVRTLPDE